jgi:hypothetical protein
VYAAHNFHGFFLRHFVRDRIAARPGIDYNRFALYLSVIVAGCLRCIRQPSTFKLKRNACKMKKKLLQTARTLTCPALVILLLAGCTADYGRLQRDADVKQAFESNQVPSDYKYYYYGFISRPYVVFGIEPKYEMDSHMWRELEPDTAEFEEAIRWIWEDYGYDRFGADILDPSGKKVGIMYTSIYEIAIEFGPENQIEVIPHTPFLWGPAADGGGGVKGGL